MSEVFLEFNKRKYASVEEREAENIANGWSSEAGVMKLAKLKRWPTLKRHLAGQFVRIFSHEWGAYWRADYSGYTPKRDEAGIYKFEDALEHTFHCGPEKGIEYEPCAPDYSI